MSGKPSEVIEQYLASYEKSEISPFTTPDLRNGSGSFRFKNLIIRDNHDVPTQFLISGTRVNIEITYQCYSAIPENLSVFIHFRSTANQFIFTCTPEVQSVKLTSKAGTVGCIIEKLPLNTGTYKIDLECFDRGELADVVLHAAHFKVSTGYFYKSGILPPPWFKMLVNYRWYQKSNPDEN